MKLNYNSLSCSISARVGFDTELCGLCSEAVVYAVSRLFASCGELRRCCVTESYAMRIASGNGRKPRRHSCVIPAALAEINVGYTVSAEGVTIQSVSLYDSYPRR